MPVGLMWAILLSELRMQGEDGLHEGQGPVCIEAADATPVPMLSLTFVCNRPATEHVYKEEA